MVIALMRGILFEAAIDGTALVTNRHGGDHVIENKVNRRRDKQADEFGVITKNHADGKDEQTETRIEILLQIKFVVTANAATLDYVGFCRGEVRQIHVTSIAGQARFRAPISFLLDVAMRADKFNGHILYVLKKINYPKCVCSGAFRRQYCKFKKTVSTQKGFINLEAFTPEGVTTSLIQTGIIRYDANIADDVTELRHVKQTLVDDAANDAIAFGHT